MPVVRFFGDERVQSATGCRIETIVDIGDDPVFGRVHRLGRHALDDADAGNDDLAGAQFVDEPVQQNASIGQANCFGLQPRAKCCAHRLREIGEPETRLDREKLVVSCWRASRETSNHFCIDPDLLGYMIEHDGGKQFTASEMPPWITQTAKLQSIAKAGLGSAGAVDGSEVVCIQTMMAKDHRLVVGQRQ